MKYYSDIQKNENLLCVNMDRIKGYQLSGIREKDKNRYHTISLICGF